MTTPANPDDLTAWLRAIYDERERTALAAGGRDAAGQWRHARPGYGGGAVEDAAGNIVVYDEGSPTEAQAAHIADNDPANELRDLDAKRRILDRHASYDFPYDPEDGPGDYSWTGRCDYCHEPWPCPDLRDLASPYADRPGYREEWKP